jgi:preprotein translocase subunit SecF
MVNDAKTRPIEVNFRSTQCSFRIVLCTLAAVIIFWFFSFERGIDKTETSQQPPIVEYEDTTIKIKPNNETFKHLLWPIPQQVQFGNGTVYVNCRVTLLTDHTSELLGAVMKRFKESQEMLWGDTCIDSTNEGKLNSINLFISDITESTKRGSNEAYNLSISEHGAVLSSESIYGVMHGLVSL